MLTFDVEAEPQVTSRASPATVGLAVGESRSAGITAVLTVGRHGYRVTCTCGTFSGRRRLLRGSAVAEAYLHAATNNCIPAQPLIDPHVGLVGGARRG